MAIFRRRLKAGKTFEDFKRAWEAEQGFGVPARVFNAISIEDPREILTAGLVALDPAELAASTERVAVQERRRHDRIDDVIDSTEFSGMYELATEHDFSGDPREIEAGGPESLLAPLIAPPIQAAAVGRVESELTDPAVAPKQGHEGVPDATLVFEPGVLEALDGLQVGDHVIILTWLDRANRDTLRVHPRDDPANPLRGVFGTRSADRPNPIGLHEVVIAAVDGERVRVRGLEAVDGTPVLDVKPVLRRT